MAIRSPKRSCSARSTGLPETTRSVRSLESQRPAAHRGQPAAVLGHADRHDLETLRVDRPHDGAGGDERDLVLDGAASEDHSHAHSAAHAVASRRSLPGAFLPSRAWPRTIFPMARARDGIPSPDSAEMKKASGYSSLARSLAPSCTRSHLLNTSSDLRSSSSISARTPRVTCMCSSYSGCDRST